MSIDQGFP